MKIVVLCEGRTEQVLRTGLQGFLERHAREAPSGARPAQTGLSIKGLNGPVLRKKLPRLVDLYGAKEDVVGVIALTDVYPGFSSAHEAKAQLREPTKQTMYKGKFRAHAAQFELEAWLLPFWDDIVKYLGLKGQPPGANPEEVNNQKPPSKHLKELFRRANREYDKVRYAAKWLTADRLEIAAGSCPELKAFLNSILELAGAAPLP